MFGLMALVVGFDFLGWAVYFALHPEAAADVETAGLPASVLYAVSGVITGTIAALFLTRRAYRPDLGDVAFSDRSLRWLLGLPSNWTQPTNRRIELVNRTWWTGEIRRQ